MYLFLYMNDECIFMIIYFDNVMLFLYVSENTRLADTSKEVPHLNNRYSMVIITKETVIHEKQ